MVILFKVKLLSIKKFVVKLLLNSMLKSLDILLLLLLIWGAYSGFKKGFVSEVFSLGAFFLATIGSVKLMDYFAGFLNKCNGNLGSLAPYLAFVLIFLGIVVAITLVGRLFKYLINLTILGWIDRLAGTVLGVFKWAFFVSTFLWIADLLHFNVPNNYLSETHVFPIIKSLAPRLLGWLPSWLPMLQEWFARIKGAANNLTGC
jgi:membrane protein required for colicin V production